MHFSHLAKTCQCTYTCPRSCNRCIVKGQKRAQVLDVPWLRFKVLIPFGRPYQKLQKVNNRQKCYYFANNEFGSRIQENPHMLVLLSFYIGVNFLKNKLSEALQIVCILIYCFRLVPSFFSLFVEIANLMKQIPCELLTI